MADVAIEGGPRVKELIRSYVTSVRALRERGVVRSPKVLGDYAEWLAARALGFELVKGGADKGYDGRDAADRRYQVKARVVAPPYPQPDLRGQGALEAEAFDLLVGVLFDAELEVTRAAVIPVAVVLERATRIRYNNGWRLSMGSGLLSDPRVDDVTAVLKLAAEA